MTEPSAAPSPAPAEPAAAPPPRRPRLIRWWAVVLIPAMLLLAALALPLVIDPWVRSLVVAGLERAGLDLDPASRLSVSVFGARLRPLPSLEDQSRPINIWPPRCQTKTCLKTASCCAGSSFSHAPESI